jgi:hypothetical protein
MTDQAMQNTLRKFLKGSVVEASHNSILRKDLAAIMTAKEGKKKRKSHKRDRPTASRAPCRGGGAKGEKEGEAPGYAGREKE